MSTFDLPPDEDRSWAPKDEPGVRSRFCLGASRISIETGARYESIALRVMNFAPRELSYSVRHGQQGRSGTAAASSEFEVRLPYDPDATCLEIGSQTWRPSELLGTPDEREIGLAIESIRLEHRAGQ
jgi:hypothetical protein